MTKLSFSLAAFLIFFLSPCVLFADTVKTEEWQIEADKVLRFDNPKSVIAEGQVVLTKIRTLPPKKHTSSTKSLDWSALLEEETTVTEEVVTQETDSDASPRIKTEITIRADWIAYDVEQNSIKARGNVSIETETDQLLADEGILNLTNETGLFKEATILRDSLDLHLEGKTIEKTGFNTYHIENGWVVTCKIEADEDEGKAPPPWSFAASSADITQGEYATLKHATFRIKNVPVLYSPWLMIPVGNTRKTGVLFPEISNSDRSGFGFNLPLFVNLSDSADMTLFSEFYAKRGFMPGMELRYALTPQKKGGFMASNLQDDLSAPSETSYWQETGYTHTNQNRYWVRGKIDHDFTSDIITRIDLDIVSDRDYLTEFNSGLTGFQESQDRFLDVFGRGFQNKTADLRENTFKMLKSWDGMALEGVFLGINDVRKIQENPIITETNDPTLPDEDNPVITVTDNPTPLWKLPSLDFTGSRLLGDSDISLDWDTDYVNYYRKDGVGGHRFDIYPRLSMPLPMGPYLESRAEAGLRDTFYNVQTFGDATWDESDSPNRFLGEFHTEIGTTLLRDFDFKTSEMDGLSHNLRPFVQYDLLSDAEQDDLPNFDSVDRLDDVNKITYGVDNFFTLFNKNVGKENEKDYGYLKIQQHYDLRSEESDTPLSPVNIKIGWYPFTRGQLIYKTDISVYGNGVSHTMEAAYENSRGDFLNLDYRYDDLDGNDIHQFNMNARAQLWDTVFAAYTFEHSLSESQIIAQNFSLLYQPACWSVELQSKYTPGDTTISVLFNLANIGSPLGLRL